MKIPNQPNPTNPKSPPNFRGSTNSQIPDDEPIEVDSSGPSVASLKNNKVFIIVASSVLITVVLYFFFFRQSSTVQEENIEEVLPIDSTRIAPNESGKSIFEFEKSPQNKEINPELLKKQDVPDVPSLPELPKELLIPEQLDLSPKNDDPNKKGFFDTLDPVTPQNPLTPVDGSNKTNQEISGAVPKPEAPKPLTNQKTPEQIASEKNQALINEQIKKELRAERAKLNQETNQQNQIIQAQNNQTAELTEKNIDEKNKSDPRYTPIIVFSGGYTSPTNSIGSKENIIMLKKNLISELKESDIKVDATYISDSSTTIAQGKMLTAILETAINTELPGVVRAIVSRDIYGESGNKVLIPRGSRLYGSYSSSIQRGQGRVEVNWTRLIRPDGVSLNISFSASDQFGRSGIPGDVDNRYSSVIFNSLLSSVLTVGTAAAAQKLLNNNNNNNTTTTVNQNQGITTTTSNATNQAIYDVTKTIIDTFGQIITNTIDLNPVIRIPQGTRVTVIVNSDIKIPPVNQK